MSVGGATRHSSMTAGARLFRVIRQSLRPALLRRFVASVKQDGWRGALARTRGYVNMRWRGSAHTVLDGPASTPQPEAHYLQGVWQQLAQGNAFHVSAPALSGGQRFVAIVGDLNLPQCRKYRVEQLAGFWRARGVACEFAHYQDLPRVTRLLAQATHVTEYRLQSTPLTEMIRYEARRLGLPVLYDIDDPLFSVSAYETYGNMAALDPWMKAHFISEAPGYLSMMNGADLISVSTPGLAEHVTRYSRRPVHLRRNFADGDILQAGARALAQNARGDGIFRAAFASGSQGHEVDFAQIADVMETFVTGAPDRRLMLLGHVDCSALPQALAARTDVVAFSTYEAYLGALAQADCAVMPLADDLFNQCKSAVRVIDAAAAAVPSIVGPVGDLAQMVVEGKTGHVARSPGDWLARLTELADSPKGSTAMGRAARRDLETRWSGKHIDRIIDPEIIEWVRA